MILTTPTKKTKIIVKYTTFELSLKIPKASTKQNIDAKYMQ